MTTEARRHQELEPCPFCVTWQEEELAVGSEEKPGLRGADGTVLMYREYYGACSCGSRGPASDTREMAIERWNKRRRR
jgi:hypothetical protein